MSKHLINISDLSKKDIIDIIELSRKLNGESNPNILNKKKIGLIFEKPSTRTRLSFITGIYELNGIPIELNLNNLNLSRNETFADTIKMFNLYLDCLIYRTNNHEKLLVAKNYFNKPIINALSEVSHPCQILSDYLTLINHFEKENLTISWFGDINNVLYSLIELSKIIQSIKINVFSHEDIINKKMINCDNVSYKTQVCEKTLKKSDCIMTDVFSSMNDETNSNKKEKLLPYQVNQEILNLSSKSTVFMHCLPANLGEEVTDEVINSKKSIVLKQAYNRKVLQKGLMAWLDI